MKNKYLFLLSAIVFIFTHNAWAQTTEDFETETNGTTSFTDNSVQFDFTATGGGNDPWDIEPFTNGGWNGTTTDNKFIDNSGMVSAGAANGDGASITIVRNDGGSFSVNEIYIFLAKTDLSDASTKSVTVVGNSGGIQQYTFTKTSGFSNVTTFSPNNGFTLFDFATEGASDYSSTSIDELVITSSGDGEYMAFDAFQWTPASSGSVSSGTFDWETASDAGTTVSQTVNTVTATVSTSNLQAQLLNAGGFEGSSGNVAFTQNADSNTSLTITFSNSVDVLSIFTFIADGDTGPETSVLFTPTGGSNSTVTEGIAQTAGEVVTLNWTGITAITLTAPSQPGGLETFGIDDIVLGATGPSNSAPTDISLSTTSVGQSSTGVNATVATLSTTDADAGDSHTYSLVSGAGDSGNANFNINGNALRSNGALMAGTYSIRVNTNDGTDDFAKQLSITITDDIAPVVSSVSVPSADTYDVSENLDFTVNFNENITVNTSGGTPQLALTIGSTTRQAVYQSGTGSQDIVFRYAVQNGDIDVDGIAVNSLSANGGTLQDAANNNANLTLNSVGSTASVFVYTSDVTYTTANGFQPANPSGLDLTNYDLTIQDGTAVISSATTFNTVTVQPNAILDLNANITVGNEVLFESDATGSALINDATGNSITGDVTIERYIPAKRTFRLLTSPVGGQTFANSWQQDTHITGAAGTAGQTSAGGFDETETGNPSLFTFNNAVNPQAGGAGWQAIANTNATNLEAGTPYRILIRGDRSVDLTSNESAATATTLKSTGSLPIGSLSTGSQLPALATVADNYSFVGNPYQAVVDFNLVTKSNLVDFIYVWDAAIAGTNGNGGFVTVEVSTGSITAPSPSSSSATRYLAPGQAFFVQNNASGNGSITFDEDDKANGQTQPTIFSTYANFYINSRLYKTEAFLNNEMESDAIGLRFSENYTTLGSDEDAGKLGNQGENYAILNNGLRSIDKQGLPIDGHEVELISINYQAEEYTLWFNYENKPEQISVFLEDTYLDTQVELTDATTTYAFSVDQNIPESINPYRFKLIFGNETLSDPNFSKELYSVYPNPANTQIYVSGIKETATIKVFDLLGKEILRQANYQTDEAIQINQLEAGVYLIKVEDSGSSFTQKFIKK